MNTPRPQLPIVFNDREPHDWVRADPIHLFKTCRACGGRWYDGREPSRSCGGKLQTRANGGYPPFFPKAR